MQNIEHLNADCTCISLDRDGLCRALAEVVGDPQYSSKLAETHPHLISSQPLFLTTKHAVGMQRIITAIEEVVQIPSYRSAIQQHVPELARSAPGPIGVFMGYDFHLSADGPKLIEINTNAGGALINAYLLGAQIVCCGEMAPGKAASVGVEGILAEFVESFRSEWSRQGRQETLSRIAIVDDAPESQFLYPEFVLFKRLFEKHGIAAVIAEPEALEMRDNMLWQGPDRIDLVYNRLTDFDLSAPAHRTLHDAYRSGAAVITPNPWAYAHFADKRNLTVLSDDRRLSALGVSSGLRTTLCEGIPRTIAVSVDNADELWKARDTLFFKPATGYGSKAAYRGDKLTHKVWSSILSGEYVAQKIIAPSARAVAIDGNIVSLKADLRCYTYAGRVHLIAARLYSGQTTNFRTAGGGFAPVFVSAETADCSCVSDPSCVGDPPV